MRCDCHRLRLIKHAYMQVICQFLNQLGCVLPSEPTRASITAAVLIARHGDCSACELSQPVIDMTYQWVRARMKSLYKKAEPKEFIQVLPPNAGALLRLHPDVANAIYSKQQPPISCPLNQAAMAHVRSRVSMRGFRRQRSLAGKLMHPPCMHAVTTANLRNIYASKYACMQVRVYARHSAVYTAMSFRNLYTAAQHARTQTSSSRRHSRCQSGGHHRNSSRCPNSRCRCSRRNSSRLCPMACVCSTRKPKRQRPLFWPSQTIQQMLSPTLMVVMQAAPQKSPLQKSPLLYSSPLETAQKIWLDQSPLR